MNGKRKSWKERALELLAEQQADWRLPIEDWGEETVGWEDWVTLRPKAVRFAAGEMKRRRLPDPGPARQQTRLRGRQERELRS